MPDNESAARTWMLWSVIINQQNQAMLEVNRSLGYRRISERLLVEEPPQP